MKDRLTELEIKASLTEDLVEELNRAIFRQQQQLDLLQEQLRHLYGRMQANAEPVEAREARRRARERTSRRLRVLARASRAARPRR